MEKKTFFVVEHIKSGRVFGKYETLELAVAERERLYTKFPRLKGMIFVESRELFTE